MICSEISTAILIISIPVIIALFCCAVLHTNKEKQDGE